NSIRKYTAKDSYELIIVDNNSTDDTVDYLKSQEDLICIFNEDNKGFAGGCNQGIKIASGDNVLLLNNDIIVTPNWLDNMIFALYSDESIGAVGPITNSCSNFQQVFLPVSPEHNNDDFFNFYNKSDSNKWEERLRLIGFCLLIKKVVVDKVGYLDELFSMGNYEDDDYSFRIRKNGYRLLLCRDTFIFHLGSASFSKDQDKFINLLNENRQKFLSKWNVDPNLMMPIRKDLTSLVKEFGKEDLNLLYVGCSSCSNLLDIKNELPNSNLFGIEPDENLVINVSHFADIKIGNEYKINEFEKKHFDYIIIDYLSPNITTLDLDFINLMKNYVNESGNIFIILPNIYNHQIRQITKSIKSKVNTSFSTIISQMFPSELQIEISN
ncbi:MAG: glycosyltransferase family 2 protein, partial [Romboutsia sp.]|uniref:glycosyltransferase family 2 protein n=1 Tax=Romboutsia sp. TaxID=1965302 RepID=UPI003F322447